MELFKIMGKIAIDNSQANSALKETSSNAKGTADTISKSNQKTQSSNKSTGSSWGNLKTKVSEYKAQGMSTSQAWKQAAQDMKTSTESAESGMTSAFKKIGAAVATYMTIDAIKNFGLGCIQAAADANAASSQFSQVFGDLESSASTILSNIADDAGITENRMKGSFTKIAAFAKTTGMDTESALALSERAMIAVADSAAFYDRSLEETTESLQSFLKGNYENDAALGLSCTEVTRNAAANKLYGKSFNDLSESQKQLTLLQMVEDANALSGALGQAARESDTWTNVTGNLKQSWTDFQAALGQHVLPKMTDLVKKFTEFVQTATDKVEPAVDFLSEKFNALKDWLSEVGSYASEQFQPAIENLKTAFDTVKDAVQPVVDKFTDYVTSGEGAEDATNLLKDAIDLVAEAAIFVSEGLTAFTDWCSEHQSTVETIAVVVGSFAAAWGLVNGAMQLWNVVGVVSTTVTTGFASAIAFLTSPITIAVAAIGALIAIGVLLYQNWDTIKAMGAELWTNLKDGFNQLKENVVENVTALKEKAVDKFNELKDKASTAASTLKDKASSAWDSLKEKTSSAFNSAKDSASTAWNTLKDKVSSTANSAKDTVSSAWSNLKDKTSTWFNNAKDSASTAFSDLKSKVVEYASSAGTQAGEKFESMKSTISLATSTAKSLASSAFESMKSTISTHVNAALTTVQNTFNSIKQAISDKLNEAWGIVQDIIQKVKDAFDFSLKLDIKLPHVSVSGGVAPYGIGGKGKLPSFSVEWYKKAYDKAMILSDPTIFGYSAASGKMLGGGDGNGNEVVAGESHLMNLIGQVVESKAAGQNDRIIEILIAILHAITGGNEELLRALLSGQKIVLNEREFARAVRTYA